MILIGKNCFFNGIRCVRVKSLCLEKFISMDALCSYSYANLNIGSDWPPGENAIAKNPELSYKYATYVLGTRFPKGEKTLMHSDNNWSYYYEENFGKVLKRVIN